MMNGFVRVLALLPGLVLTTELLNRAGADWFGAYMATMLTLGLSCLLSDRFIIAPESALTAELVFSSVFIMGLGHGAAKVILLLGALLALPVGHLLGRCTERLRQLILSTASVGLSLLLLSVGLSRSGIIQPAVMMPSQLGNLLAPDVFVTLMTIVVMGILQTGKSTKKYTFGGGLLFAFLLAALEGFLDFDYGVFALPTVENLGKVWFAFDFPTAWGILLTAPGDIIVPALTIAVTMVTMSRAVCSTSAAIAAEKTDDDEVRRINGKSALLGLISAGLGSGPVTVSPLSLLKDEEENPAAGRRYGMLAGAAVLLFCAPLARSIAECPGIIAPLYIWLGGVLTAGWLKNLTGRQETDDAASRSWPLVIGASVIAALSYNLTAGIGAALIGHSFMQIFDGRDGWPDCIEWLIIVCYVLYFSSYCF